MQSHTYLRARVEIDRLDVVRRQLTDLQGSEHLESAAVVDTATRRGAELIVRFVRGVVGCGTSG